MSDEPDRQPMGDGLKAPHRASPPPFEEGEETAPPGVKVMGVVRWLLLLGVVLAAFFSIYTYAAPLFGQSPATSQKVARYFCPMHPQITSERPGECPICHMALEPMPERKAEPTPPTPAPHSTLSSAPSSSAARPIRPPPDSMRPSHPGSSDAPNGYFCPMHPQVHSDTPGRCSICGMDLVPAPASASKVDTASPATAPPAPPPDTAPLTLTLDRTQAIGVRSTLVERRGSSVALRVTAAVDVPEQGRTEIHVRAPGYVEAISVRDLGVKVKAGETLASIYSPEVFQAQQELLAMKAWPNPTGSDLPPPMSSARRKLELLGVGKEIIDRVLATGQPIRAIGVVSPISGYVTRKETVLGSYATPDKVLFEVADLSHVYILASVYPYQLAAVHVGDEAIFTTPSLPGQSFATRVDLIYPEVNVTTRTARVRFQVDNKGLALRPGQFGTIELRGKVAEALTIPMDAVIDTGRSVYVFLVGDGGHFEARSVELGEQIGDRFVVKAGVEEGQRIVSGATFLIDAESRLQASLAATSADSAVDAGATHGAEVVTP